MITADDLEYHTPPGADHEWAETYFFPIAVPEAHLLAQVYVVVRPVLGVMTNDLIVYGCLSSTRCDLLYLDTRQHLPAPARFSDIDSPSGLRLKAVKPPRNYRIDYVGAEDTEFHVDWNGIMDPFDIHDPAHSPLAQSATVSDRDAHSGVGAAYRGHFDMTGRVTGTLKVRGTEYAVDCIERMDHSWGVRGEMNIPCMNSISATIGTDFALHLIVRLDINAPVESSQKLAHGYILENGKVYGVEDLTILTTRSGSIVTTMDMAVTDIRGKVHHLEAMADIGAPWMAYSSGVTWNSLMRWTCDGKAGYGVVMEHLALRDLQRRYGRTWQDFPAAFEG